MTSITSHTVVRNEDRFIWFAIKSVIDHVDQMFIYDTGSTDRTVDIIKTINSPKILFKKYGPKTPKQISALRQLQLDQTKTDWFLILDGDEIWWQDSIKAVKKTIDKSPKLYGVITPTINSIGDIYHYQDESAGHYQFGNRKGHLAVRAINAKIKGIHLGGDYPLEGYFDHRNNLVTDYSDKLTFVDKPYFHATNLSRSTASEKGVISREKKYEIGHTFDKNFKYPEVFYQKRPSIVPDPFQQMPLTDRLISAAITPAKILKRKINNK